MASSGTPSPETLLPGNGHTNMRSLLQITCSSKGKRTHIWSALHRLADAVCSETRTLVRKSYRFLRENPTT